MRVRVRGPSGQTTLTLEESTTISDFKQKLAEISSLTSFTAKLGAPPLPLEELDLDSPPPDTPLSSTGYKLANNLITLSTRDVPASTPITASQTSSQASAIPSTASSSQSTQAKPAKAPEHLSLQRAPPPSIEYEPPEVFVPEWGMNLALRVMPDDNSCLFRALGTCLLTDDIDSATELRDIVATVILNNPDKYSEGFLGMKVEEYTRKIKSPDAWGGEIEISIIAEYFGVAVDTINVKDQHVYSYNQSASQKCIIVYSGIHYDAVAMTSTEGGLDIKQFDSQDVGIVEKARQICRILSERHYYTDTSDFSIKCNVGGCGWKGNGEKAAEKHAMETGHYEFGEETR